MATVNLKSVSKSYEGHPILHDIDINIEKGEFVAVVGPSGCGKSTLLRLVAGLDNVTAGQVLINNKCVNKTHPSDRDMAMVFQTYALYPHMTAYDNMAYGLKMRGMKKNIIHQRVMNVAVLLQLSDFLHRKPIMLSGGQRQRVAMGRAIVRSPAVFLFDEPLSNLDAKLRTEMRHEIKKLHQTLNTTCLYVTHDQTEAMTLADRIVVLNQGRVEQVGAPRDLYQHPETLFVANFIGHFPMNFLPAKIDLKQGIIRTTTGNNLPLPSLKSLADNADVVVGIRSEDIRITEHSDSMSILGNVEFVDDMGADKLVQMMTDVGNVRLSVRVSGDRSFNHHRLAVGVEMSKASLFCQQTGRRLGGWNA